MRYAIVLSCLLGGTAAAQGPDPRTALLAGSCGGCHGAAGQGAGAIPPIAQTRPRAEFAALMRGYRANEGAPTVMNRIARGYTDAEIDLLAARWGQAQ